VTLPLVITGKGQPILDALASLRWAADTHLHGCGGLLYRGFGVADASAFCTFARGFGHPLLSYEFGSTPRSRVVDGVYSSTEYPAHQHIPLHNEQAYTRDWPMKIWFHCAVAAPQGGETPIADSRQVYQRIAPEIRQRFVERGLMYVRNYGNGLDVPWQQTFGTTEPAVVEAYCRGHDIAFEWKADGELRTRQIAQAVARHPQTAELVWFNQAHLFHVSALEPAVREALCDAVDAEDLPRNVCYADGGALEDDVLDEIRGVYRALEIVFPWQPGDVLMLDNMLTAHGRLPFTGPRQITVAMAEPHTAPGDLDEHLS
jgi:alpha-ketoglutarate-dependent taurine dioxygenase